MPTTPLKPMNRYRFHLPKIKRQKTKDVLMMNGGSLTNPYKCLQIGHQFDFSDTEKEVLTNGVSMVPPISQPNRSARIEQKAKFPAAPTTDNNTKILTAQTEMMKRPLK